MNLAIGMATAPRPRPTLDQALSELRRAGFPHTIHVFAEPGTPISAPAGITWHQNSETLGIWRNWLRMATTLLRETDARHFLICQDDLRLARGAAEALAQAIETLPQESWGVATLYTPLHNVESLSVHPGWQAFPSRHIVWGALAYCFSRESLTAFLHSPEVILHRGQKNVDTIVSQAISALGRKFYFHVPSLCDHAPGDGNSTVGHPRLASSAGLDFDPQYAPPPKALPRPPESQAAHLPRSTAESRDPNWGDPDGSLKRLTLIMPSWKRPDQVARILGHQRQYSLIERVICWNNNPEVHFQLDGVECINCDRDQSLYTRFAAAALASTDAVLLQDDDLLVPEETIRTLYNHWRHEPGVIHGTQGRTVADGIYRPIDRFGAVDLVLTRCLVMHRDLCLEALRYWPFFRDLPGDGEDIVLSAAARARTGRPHWAYPLPYQNLAEPHAISRRAGHLAHRTQFVKRCLEVFGR